MPKPPTRHGAQDDSRTPQALARIIASTRPSGAAGKRAAAYKQLMPTAAPRNRSRVSAFDLTLKLKALGLGWSEAEVSAGLASIAERGLANRGDGGYAVVDWHGLALFGGGDD